MHCKKLLLFPFILGWPYLQANMLDYEVGAFSRGIRTQMLSMFHLTGHLNVLKWVILL